MHLTIKLFQTSFRDEPNESVNIGIKRFLLHPNFKRNSKSKANDIALIELLEPVSFTSMIQPACLAQSEDKNIGELINIGYGSAYIDGKGLSDY